jgi:hypothetical protein
MYRRLNDDGTHVSVIPLVKDLRVVALDSWLWKEMII